MFGKCNNIRNSLIHSSHFSVYGFRIVKHSNSWALLMQNITPITVTTLLQHRLVSYSWITAIQRIGVQSDQLKTGEMNQIWDTRLSYSTDHMLSVLNLITVFLWSLVYCGRICFSSCHSIAHCLLWHYQGLKWPSSGMVYATELIWWIWLLYPARLSVHARLQKSQTDVGAYKAAMRELLLLTMRKQEQSVFSVLIPASAF